MDNIQERLLDDSLDHDVVEQMNMFCNQASINKIQFVGMSVVHIDMSMFFTIIATIVTYLVVLEQMEPC